MKRLFAAVLLGSAVAGASATPEPGPEAAVGALWRALSHGPNRGGDVEALNRLFHAQAVVLGGRYAADGRPSFRSTPAADFVRAVGRIDEQAFHECEVAREVKRYDRFASVYSIVESRTDPAAPQPDFTGVNSLQLYRGDDGWRIVSLYYHVEKPGQPIPLGGGRSGRCLD